MDQSCNQAGPHTLLDVHDAWGQGGHATAVSFNQTVDSNPFQGFPSTQATSSGDSNSLVVQSYYQGYPHVPSDTHNIPDQEGRETIVSFNRMVHSDPFQVFLPSTFTQPRSSNEPHTPLRANDALCLEECQMYSGVSNHVIELNC